MLAKLLEYFTGKDDLERVAYREDHKELNAYLKTRAVLIPRRPRRFLDPKTCTPQQIDEQIRGDLEDLAGNSFEPWILEVNGQRRLPVFSSQKTLTVFARKIGEEMNVIFAVGCIQVLLHEITKKIDVDFVDLNLYSKKSWELGVKPPKGMPAPPAAG